MRFDSEKPKKAVAVALTASLATMSLPASALAFAEDGETPNSDASEQAAAQAAVMASGQTAAIQPNTLQIIDFIDRSSLDSAATLIQAFNWRVPQALAQSSEVLKNTLLNSMDQIDLGDCYIIELYMYPWNFTPAQAGTKISPEGQDGFFTAYALIGTFANTQVELVKFDGSIAATKYAIDGENGEEPGRPPQPNDPSNPSNPGSDPSDPGTNPSDPTDPNNPNNPNNPQDPSVSDPNKVSWETMRADEKIEKIQSILEGTCWDADSGQAVVVPKEEAREIAKIRDEEQQKKALADWASATVLTQLGEPEGVVTECVIVDYTPSTHEQAGQFVIDVRIIAADGSRYRADAVESKMVTPVSYATLRVFSTYSMDEEGAGDIQGDATEQYGFRVSGIIEPVPYDIGDPAQQPEEEKPMLPALAYATGNLPIDSVSSGATANTLIPGLSKATGEPKSPTYSDGTASAKTTSQTTDSMKAERNDMVLAESSHSTIAWIIGSFAVAAIIVVLLLFAFSASARPRNNKNKSDQL